MATTMSSFFHRPPDWHIDRVHGHEAIRAIGTGAYGVTIIDGELRHPSPKALNLCQCLRDPKLAYASLVLVAGPREAIDDAFDAGADDYLVKPFHPSELVARVKLRARLPSGIPPRIEQNNDGPAVPILTSESLTYDVIHIDLATQIVRVDGGEPIDLPKQQFRLLVHFMQSIGRATTVEALRCVLRSDADEFGAGVRLLVLGLRRRLRTAGHLIESVRGAGYGIGLRDSSRLLKANVDRGQFSV